MLVGLFSSSVLEIMQISILKFIGQFHFDNITPLVYLKSMPKSSVYSLNCSNSLFELTVTQYNLVCIATIHSVGAPVLTKTNITEAKASIVFLCVLADDMLLMGFGGMHDFSASISGLGRIRRWAGPDLFISHRIRSCS